MKRCKICRSQVTTAWEYCSEKCFQEYMMQVEQGAIDARSSFS